MAVHTVPAHARATYARWSALAIISLALFCMALEAITRFGFSHISRIEGRISNDYELALAIRRGDRPNVLVVGNSLMLEGIDYRELRRSLAGRANAIGFAIEQTQYLDWYYGLRRLFAQGSQPDIVVLCMSADHLITSTIRGDYSAYYLFLLADIPQIRREAGYDLTKTSSLVLARFSLFYAGRSGLRNFMLMRTDPGYAAILQRLAAVKAQFSGDEKIEHIAELRLSALRKECATHHARFMFLLAPAFGTGEVPLLNAGLRSHTDVLVPFHLNELGRDKFRDGFHLNATGARMFTDQFAELLKNRLNRR